MVELRRPLALQENEIMRGEYPDDTFTENDVLACLEAAGKKYKRGGSRYILAQCPLHDDAHESAQIYKDDWFVKCHAGCEGGRFHITKAYPQLRSERQNRGGYTPNPVATRSKQETPMNEHKYKEFDLTEYWESLEEIPADHVFKGIPIENLHDLGWRYDSQNHRYFIPYFSASREKIPFAQWRNLGEGPRFNFWKDAKPTCYGTWNLDNPKLFVCEGASDAAVLDFCAVPWIALPSAASGELMKAMAGYCKENDIELVYAGDNDDAGNKLREALDSVMSYRVKQPPTKYKDWGEFFEAEGQEAVTNYCFTELFPQEYPTTPEEAVAAEVAETFPGAEVIKLDGDPFESKELSESPSQVSF